MRKINKLAAAIAVAVGVGAASTANAVIELKPNGRGDALLFPIYHGFFENYFTISNIENAWIQGHIRFRGAAWSGELRDFDVILSPGDVMVFRVADIDGDGEWEIDQTLDPKNFQYTGMFADANMPFTCQDTNGPIVGCMESSGGLIPSPDLVISASPKITFKDMITDGVINYQRHAGYVEFIGEAVLDGMTKPLMSTLLTSAGNPLQTKVFNQRGTTAWVWSDADGSRGGVPWGDDRGLSDVPNALSGTAFITYPGWSHGLAYNAETLVNFRTATCGGDSSSTGDSSLPGDDLGCVTYAHGNHRIDNYRIGSGDTFAGGYVNPVLPNGRRAIIAANSTPHPMEGTKGITFNPIAENRAVIVHNENGIVGNAGNPSPDGDYIYWWGNDGVPENRCDEKSIAFNNTWGPTLADGDDYEMSRSFINVSSPFPQNDELPPASQTMTNNKWDQTGILNANGNPWDLRWTTAIPGVTCGPLGTGGPASLDDFDCNWQGVLQLPPYNSVAEVEEAIRDAGQTFTAYYMDGDIFDKSGRGLGRNDGISSNTSLTTQFVSFFPTKFFGFEFHSATSGCPIIPASFTPATLEGFIANRAIVMTQYPKLANVQVWDIEENPIGFQTSNQCISPSTLAECFTATQNINFPFEVGIMGINDVKGIIAPGIPGSRLGRAVFDLLGGSDKLGTATAPYPGAGAGSNGFVGLLYAFEWDSFPPQILAHWRSMHR